MFKMTHVYLMYVLQDKFQTLGSQMSKWDPSLRLGVCLGQLIHHTGNVLLVLDPRLIHVSLQYHVVFDDSFTTVLSLRAEYIPTNWRCKLALNQRLKSHMIWPLVGKHN